MFKYLSNKFKSNKNLPEKKEIPEIPESLESKQIKHLTNLLLEQQEEINKLLHKVRSLENDMEYKANIIEVETIKKSINIDIKIKQFRDEFYADCIDQELTKSEWYFYHKCNCAKDCGNEKMCKQTQRCILFNEAGMLEQIDAIASNIIIYANKYMIELLKRCRDDLLYPNPNAQYHNASCYISVPIDLLSEKRHGDHNNGRIGYSNDYERQEIDKNIIKMRDIIVPAKREKIIKIIIKLIDNIVTLF